MTIASDLSSSDSSQFAVVFDTKYIQDQTPERGLSFFPWECFRHKDVELCPFFRQSWNVLSWKGTLKFTYGFHGFFLVPLIFSAKSPSFNMRSKSISCVPLQIHQGAISFLMESEIRI